MAEYSNKIIVSFVVPTLNSESVLPQCLQSIQGQNYPQNKIEIIVCDGGSNDNTISIANSFHCTVINNPLITSESAKAIGVRKSRGQFVALIDSDNILPSANWLNMMLKPFKNINIVGTEPWKYTYRKNGGFIERYSSLTGVNDPAALIANNYDRLNYLRPNWNGLNIPIVNHRYYQSFQLIKTSKIPTIGANGTVYRRSFLKKYFNSDYLIDVDVIKNALQKSESVDFAKVKCGIIHSYCESSITKFVKKQNRRVTDLYIYQSYRPGELIKSPVLSNLEFSLYTVLIFPMVIDTLIGYIRKPDKAWLFHPAACVITLYIYALGTIKYKLGILKPVNRLTWSQ